MEHPMLIVSFLPEHIQAKYTHVIMLFFVFLISLVLVATNKRFLKPIPNRPQMAVEGLVRGLYSLGTGIMGEKGLPYLPFIVSIGFFVGCSNLLGLIPGMEPPTQNYNTTLAAAICVFITYQFIGFKTHGIKYLKQFMGPMLPLAPLMFVIELIGHFARPVSLSMRLFGNINGEEIVVAVLFSLVPFLIPLPMYFLLIFGAFLQAFVFTLLTMVYISGALEDAH